MSLFLEDLLSPTILIRFYMNLHVRDYSWWFDPFQSNAFPIRIAFDIDTCYMARTCRRIEN